MSEVEIKTKFSIYIITNPLCRLEMTIRETVKTVQKENNFTFNPRLKLWVDENEHTKINRFNGL